MLERTWSTTFTPMSDGVEAWFLSHE